MERPLKGNIDLENWLGVVWIVEFLSPVILIDFKLKMRLYKVG